MNNFPLMMPHVHLRETFFDALDIYQVEKCADEMALQELLQQYKNDTVPKSAVVVAMNEGHAMILLVPYDCFQKIHLKDKEPEIGRDYGDDDDNREEWYRVTNNGDGQLTLLYHITIDQKEYIVERYELDTLRKLQDKRRISLGRMWNEVTRRKSYFHSTLFNQRQLDLLVIWLMRKRKSFASIKQSYCLMQNDCLEFAKDMVRFLAKLEESQFQVEIDAKLRLLTITKDSVLVSSEFSSRNITVLGVSVGVSNQSAVKSADIVEKMKKS